MTRVDLDLACGRLEAAEAADRTILDECRARHGADSRLTIAAGLALARVRRRGATADAAAPLYRARPGIRPQEPGRPRDARRGPGGVGPIAARRRGRDRGRTAAPRGFGDPRGRVPQHWQTAEARSLLGGALLGQKKTAEAAPLLRSGYEGMARSGRRDPAGRPAPAGRGARPPDRSRRGGRDEGRNGGVEGRAGEAGHRRAEAMNGPGGAKSPAPPGGFFPVVYDELRAAGCVRAGRERDGHSLDATALVHEAYLRLGAASFADRSGFFRAAAVGHAAGSWSTTPATAKAAKRGGPRTIALDGDAPALGADPDLVLDVAAALERLSREDPSSAEVARHRLFAGLSIEETAEALGLSRATAFREWAYARVLAGHRTRFSPMTGASPDRWNLPYNHLLVFFLLSRGKHQ